MVNVSASLKWHFFFFETYELGENINYIAEAVKQVKNVLYQKLDVIFDGNKKTNIRIILRFLLQVIKRLQEPRVSYVYGALQLFTLRGRQTFQKKKGGSSLKINK